MSQLKSMIQDLINGRKEQAEVALHNFVVAKTQAMIGEGMISEAAKIDSELRDKIRTASLKATGAKGILYPPGKNAVKWALIITNATVNNAEKAIKAEIQKLFPNAKVSTEFSIIDGKNHITVRWEDENSTEFAIKFVDAYEQKRQLRTLATVGPFASKQEATKWFDAQDFHPDSFGGIEERKKGSKMVSKEQAIKRFGPSV